MPCIEPLVKDMSMLMECTCTMCCVPAAPVSVPRTRSRASLEGSPTLKAVSASPLSGTALHTPPTPPVNTLRYRFFPEFLLYYLELFLNPMLLTINMYAVYSSMGVAYYFMFMPKDANGNTPFILHQREIDLYCAESSSTSLCGYLTNFKKSLVQV